MHHISMCNGLGNWQLLAKQDNQTRLLPCYSKVLSITRRALSCGTISAS